MYQQATLAIALLLEEDGKILVAKRASDRDFAPEIWEIPAGRVENGETLENAIKREAKEELGVEITKTRIIDAYQFMRKEYDMVLLTYLCQFDGEISISDEHKEMRWVTPQEAINLFSFEQQKNTITKFIEVQTG